MVESKKNRIGVHRRSSAAILFLLAAGCADLRWHKSGADPAALEQDVAECRMEARLQAGRESIPRVLSAPPMIGSDSEGRSVVVQSSSRGTDRMVLEQDLTSACMRGRGYELAPAQKR